MKRIRILIGSFIFALALSVNATPENNILEVTAQLCHLSETVNKCLCSETVAQMKAPVKTT